jgi:hypothetical protein
MLAGAAPGAGTVAGTKPRHPDTETHLDEEAGWVWPGGLEDPPRD